MTNWINSKDIVPDLSNELEMRILSFLEKENIIHFSPFEKKNKFFEEKKIKIFDNKFSPNSFNSNLSPPNSALLKRRSHKISIETLSINNSSSTEKNEIETIMENQNRKKSIFNYVSLQNIGKKLRAMDINNENN